jgi:hypothetical protein
MSEIHKHFERIANSDSGIAVLKWLMNYCGYQDPMRVMNPETHEINLVATAHNAALRDVWLETRKMIPEESLILIEHNKRVKPMQAVGDLSNDGRTSSGTGSTGSESEQHAASDAGNGKRYSRRNIQRDSDEYTRNYLADLAAERPNDEQFG